MKNDDGPITIDIKKAQPVLDLWVCDLTPAQKAEELKMLIYCPEVSQLPTAKAVGLFLNQRNTGSKR